ncbi:cell surface protein [Bifidobacterium animalis subsp. animalis MCC 0499]|uniref:DivIVA domain-containing protein n=1 Tax=Bifidobacterium animalis TaxID=28025 RepID=UPI00069BF065|nr:DivIVA domain-containing protein [Bifidobacterium animalis]KOA62230.1 cell surface protein [Bifidobacterium animalis subsp. animalis MCC 0499]
MAQEQESSSTSTSIPRVGKHSKGYDPRQVDAFVAQAHRLYDEGDPSLTLASIQNASFAMVKGGYVPAKVDAMLDRLKSALCDKQTLAEISELGRVAWKAQMEDSLHELQRHADRDHGARFASGQHKALSYKRKQVDRLIDDIMDKAAYELSEVTTDGTHPAVGDDPYPNLNAKAIENAAFTVVKGPRGYDQRQVDYYLATCADLLNRLESYQRLNENGSIPAAGTVESAAPSTPVNGVKPLFANVPQAPVAGTQENSASSTNSMASVSGTPAQAAAEQPDSTHGSFDELHAQEEAIFNTGTVSPSPVIVPPTVSQTPAAPVAAAALPFSEDSAPTETIAPVVVENHDTPSASTLGPGTHSAAHASLSSIQPITPAPRTIPSYERAASQTPSTSVAQAPSAPNTADDKTDDAETVAPAQTKPFVAEQPQASETLSSLALMAHETSSIPQSSSSLDEAKSIFDTLSVPKLTSVSIPDLPMPSSTHAPTDSSDQSQNSGERNDDAVRRYIRESQMDIDIPDLAFPDAPSGRDLAPRQ